MAQMISHKYARANCHSVEDAVLAIIDFVSDFWLETDKIVIPRATVYLKWFVIKLGEREVFCDFGYNFDTVEKIYEIAYNSFLTRAGLELNFHKMKFDQEEGQAKLYF